VGEDLDTLDEAWPPYERAAARSRLFVDSAPFELYVLPPRHWRGFAGVGGFGWHNRTLVKVEYRYVDRLDTPTKRLSVLNVQPPGPDEFEEEVYILNVLQTPPRTLSERPTLGPKGPSEIVHVGLNGLDFLSGHLRRWLNHPELLVLALPVPDVSLRAVSVGLTTDELLAFASLLVPLSANASVYAEMLSSLRLYDAALENWLLSSME